MFLMKFLCWEFMSGNRPIKVDNIISVWFYVSTIMNRKCESDNSKANKITFNAYFAPNEKGDEKLVTKPHQHL